MTLEETLGLALGLLYHYTGEDRRGRAAIEKVHD